MLSTLRFVCAVLFVAPATAPLCIAGDWAQWRGPNRNNIAAAGQHIPAEWSDSKNVLWRAEVPGRGHSSPIVVGDLIVLTSADEQGQRQAVIAFDRGTGKQKWLTVISEGGFPPVHDKNTHASPTVASNGELFFATFCHHGKVEAVAVDAAGKIVWKQDVGGFVPRQYEYGYACSPTVYNDTVVISGDSDTIAWIKALDVTSGKIRWQQKRPHKLNWASPIATNLHGREQMLISGGDMLASYDPQTGEPLWSTPCLTMATCGTVTFEDGIVFASGGYPKAETVAVKGDGSGEILWRNNVKLYEQSLLVHKGFVYGFSDAGVLYCWNAKTGQEMWKTRLRGPVSASPVLVGDTIFASNEAGTTYVFKASPLRYEQVAVNQLGEESFATPAVVDSVMYLRVASGRGAGRRETLYAIGNK